MADSHAMERWLDRNGMTIADLAVAANCSGAHLRNIFAGRKQASLPLATRLSAIARGKIKTDAFLRPRRAGANE